MTYSVRDLDARYTISHELDDCTLRARWVVRFSGKWLNSFPDRDAAEYFARMYASLCK